MAKNKINVLFVCTGNICRSPMAEYLFRSRLDPNSPWTAGSAGLSAVDGLAASQTAVEVMNEIGIDMKTHRSRELASGLNDAATIILVMTGAHAAELKQRFPRARDRVHLLGSFRRDQENHPLHGRPPGTEIADPVGAGAEVYRRTLGDIGKCLDGLIDYLKTYGKE